MFLSDRTIRKYLADGHLRVEPIEDRQIQPCSIDLRLGPTFLRWPAKGIVAMPIDPKSPPPMERVEVNEGKCFALSPGHLILASTVEQVHLPSTLVGFLEGKSSLARLGLQVHSTGGVIDCGFVGQITLELSVTGPYPLLLWPGMAVAQLLLADCTTPDRPYGHPELGSHYQGQVGPTASRYQR